MNILVHLDAAFCERLVLTLAHFLWQGTAVSAVAIAAAASSRSARMRYAILTSGLFVMAVCPLITISLVSASEANVRFARTASPNYEPLVAASDRHPSAASPPPPHLVVGDSGKPVAALRGRNEPDPKELREAERPRRRDFVRPVAAAYLLGVVALLGRLALGFTVAGRLRTASLPVTDPLLLATAERLARRIGLVLAPPLHCCVRTAVPCVVGFLKPVVLLPVSLVTGLDSEQLEAVLLHEFAHVRRLDPLVNVLQRLVEATLFYHPCVWALSSRIRVERENCCDDLAVAAGAGPFSYARVLLEVAERECSAPVPAAVASLYATGRVSHLGRRVRRLLGEPAAEEVLLTRKGTAMTIGLTTMFLSAFFLFGEAGGQGLAGDAAPRIDETEKPAAPDAAKPEPSTPAEPPAAEASPAPAAAAVPEAASFGEIRIVRLTETAAYLNLETGETFGLPEGLNREEKLKQLSERWPSVAVRRLEGRTALWSMDVDLHPVPGRNWGSMTADQAAYGPKWWRDQKANRPLEGAPREIFGVWYLDESYPPHTFVVYGKALFQIMNVTTDGPVEALVRIRTVRPGNAPPAEEPPKTSHPMADAPPPAPVIDPAAADILHKAIATARADANRWQDRHASGRLEYISADGAARSEVAVTFDERHPSFWMEFETPSSVPAGLREYDPIHLAADGTILAIWEHATRIGPEGDIKMLRDDDPRCFAFVGTAIDPREHLPPTSLLKHAPFAAVEKYGGEISLGARRDGLAVVRLRFPNGSTNQWTVDPALDHRLVRLELDRPGAVPDSIYEYRWERAADGVVPVEVTAMRLVDDGYDTHRLVLDKHAAASELNDEEFDERFAGIANQARYDRRRGQPEVLIRANSPPEAAR